MTMTATDRVEPADRARGRGPFRQSHRPPYRHPHTTTGYHRRSEHGATAWRPPHNPSLFQELGGEGSTSWAGRRRDRTGCALPEEGRQR